MKKKTTTLPLVIITILSTSIINANSKENDDRQANIVKEVTKQILKNKKQFRNVPFATIIENVTDKTIIPVDTTKPADRAIIDIINQSARKALAKMNSPESPTNKLRRINEASRYFEDDIQTEIHRHPDFTCEIPKTSTGKEQRSGYPDLIITHIPSGKKCYLDPKLHEQGSKKSSFRTFYFEPKSRTNKIHFDAHHLILGITHDGKDGKWQFLGWTIADLAHFKVRLKAEFQASNREMYDEKLIITEQKIDLEN